MLPGFSSKIGSLRPVLGGVSTVAEWNYLLETLAKETPHTTAPLRAWAGEEKSPAEIAEDLNGGGTADVL